MSVISKIKQLAKLKKKAYRDAYVEEHVKTSLPFQIRALREQREWSQTELGEKAGMRQNAICRLEDAESTTPSITTLLRLAKAFDVALLVKFVPFRKLLDEFSDLSTQALEVNAFDEELPILEEDALSVISGWKVITSHSIRLAQPNIVFREANPSWTQRYIFHFIPATGSLLAPPLAKEVDEDTYSPVTDTGYIPESPPMNSAQIVSDLTM